MGEASSEGVSEGVSDVVSVAVASVSSSLPQAARPRDIVRAIAARPDLRAMWFMGCCLS